MAVRIFDLSEPQALRLPLVQAPSRRRDARRTSRRYAVAGVVGLSVPFVVALAVLGATH